MEKKQKIISSIIFILIIFLFPIIFIFSEKKDILEEENREPAEKPKFSFSSVFDKSYMSKMDSFLSDNFPNRIGWIKTKMSFDRITGKTIINDIYLGDGMLIEKLPKPDYSEVNKSVQAINQFAQHYNTRVWFLLAPTSAGIYSEKLPLNAPQINQRKFINETFTNLNDNVNIIDIYDEMLSKKDNYIYYRTDHHWTSYGAYIAYKKAASKLGFTAENIDKFNIEHASDDFRGTFYNKCFYDKIEKDIIDIYSLQNGSKVKKVILNDGRGEEETNSIFFREFLDESDKYCVFTGKNRAYTNIKTDNTNDKKILIIKDSYANSFIPFLINHYSEISVIDLRYVKTSISDFVDPNEYDDTLFLYNASTFSTDPNVKMTGFF